MVPRSGPMPAVAREEFGPCVGPGRSPEGLGEPMEARRRAPRVPLNRSRAGIRPISVRNRTDLDEGGDFLGVSQAERGGFPGVAGYIVIAAGRGGPRGLGNPMTGPPSRSGRVLGSPGRPLRRRRMRSPGYGNPGSSPSTTKARGLGETPQDAGRVMSAAGCHRPDAAGGRPAAPDLRPRRARPGACP